MKARVLPVIAIGAAVIAVALAIAAWRRSVGGAAAPADHTSGAGWDAAWIGARACLLGATPASTDHGEAVAAADLLTPDRTCGRELIVLARAAGSGEAWTRVHRAIGELADAVGKHQQRRLVPDPDLGPDPLPRAIDEVDATARKASGGAPAATGSGPATAGVLPRLTAAALMVDGEIAGMPGVWRGSLYVSKPSTEARYEIRFVDGAPLPLPLPLDGTGSVWSPRGTWQAFVDETGKKPRVVMQNDSGDQAWPVATATDYASVIATIGEGSNRLIVYRDNPATYLARTIDDGVHWTRIRLPMVAGPMSTAVSTAGDRLDLAWTDDAGVKRLALLPAQHATGALPDPTELAPGATVWSDCGVGSLWIMASAGDEFIVHRADAAAAAGRWKTQPMFGTCSAGKATIVDDKGDEWLCSSVDCKPMPRLAVVTQSALIGDDLVRYAVQDGVVAVWRGSQPPAFAHLPGDRVIAGVLDGGGGKAIAILTTDNRTEYVELPR